MDRIWFCTFWLLGITARKCLDTATAWWEAAECTGLDGTLLLLWVSPSPIACLLPSLLLFYFLNPKPFLWKCWKTSQFRKEHIRSLSEMLFSFFKRSFARTKGSSVNTWPSTKPVHVWVLIIKRKVLESDAPASTLNVFRFFEMLLWGLFASLSTFLSD